MHRIYGRLRVWVVVLAVVLLLGAGSLVLAADAGADRAGAVEVAEPKTLLDTINSGGLVGYIIIFLSVVAIALTIEHLMTIRRSIIMPPDVLAEVEECFEKEKYDEAIAACEGQPTFFTNVLAAGLARVNAGYKQMEEAMAEAGEEAATGLQQKTSYLALIANIAPMLGLLGTVQGMISAFNKIAVSTAPKPAELADSIQLALVTTFLGLFVAIPVMCVHHFFKNKVQKIILEVGAISGELMARFRPVE